MQGHDMLSLEDSCAQGSFCWFLILGVETASQGTCMSVVTYRRTSDMNGPPLRHQYFPSTPSISYYECIVPSVSGNTGSLLQYAEIYATFIPCQPWSFSYMIIFNFLTFSCIFSLVFTVFKKLTRIFVVKYLG